MSQKGGSDFDVFEGVAKKPRSSVPASRAPVPPPPPAKKTLLGMAVPPLPPPPSRGVSAPPPPPPPPSKAKPSLPPGPPPSRVTSRQPAQNEPITSAPPPPPPPPPAALHSIPVPPPPPPPSAPGVQMDWDDEDEATTVFGRPEEAGAALLRAPMPAAGTPAVPPVFGPGSPSGAPPVASLLSDSKAATRAPMPAVATPVAAAPAPAFAPLLQQPASGRGVFLKAALGALLVIAVVAGFVVYLGTRAGSLLVTVAGPNNKRLDSVEVYLTGQVVCDKSPCSIPDLKPGRYLVRASAPGYVPLADQPVMIEAGQESLASLTLQAASAGTGISVSAEFAGLKLFIDGQEIGTLPQDVKDLTPGEHKIRIEAPETDNYAFEPLEQTVTVEADKLLKLEPRLKVLKGQIKLEEGANAAGASVLLVSEGERRRLPVLPATLKVEASKQYSIVATRDGYEEYRQAVAFEDGEPSRTYTIELRRRADERPSAAAASRPTPGTVRDPGASAPAPKPAPAATGEARLNLNSIPVSSVILNGRPLGSTPKLGVSVPPGSHTVVFVHAEFGRRVQTVTVGAGETKTAAVRFQ